ncbi:protein STRUBBELIG-RECEPTOR FAMILY 3 isoform X1 [Cinnamomum micranthum f. kanehirae]|uniref:Protein STRUBBELIG-RECEPTOR FAMILY 3 isoform X1 n=1 Tax=Cinnamomum micranthum f. kanehirae TaxID=337451 RepID=A0A443PIY9_9MAGN|nr:protein STRUBBELIG-RECEPTOR FAMILY 3 isoform X1 [Cinnamomum micranthum f. kanehirae]
MGKENSKLCALFVMCLMVIFVVPFSHGLTNGQDVYAINSLYIALGSPPLPGWVSTGGDPCAQGWQGVQCVGSNISTIVINGANLGGQLGDQLMNFSSIETIDLSNNQIGGSIPNNLPTTIKTFFLSANQFTGSIPDSLSTLTLLSAIDLSSNNLSGQLPHSLQSLSALTTLNIENNLFLGPVPEKMLSIPNFKRDGNPLNTTAASSPSPLTSPPSSSEGPTAPATPGKSANGPSSQDGSQSKRSRKSRKTILIVAFVAIGVIVCIVGVLLVAMLLIRCCEKQSKLESTTMRPETGGYKGTKEKPKGNNSLIEHTAEANKVPVSQEVVQKPMKESQIDTVRTENVSQKPSEQLEMDMARVGVIAPTPPAEKVTVNAIVPAELPRDLSLPTSFTVGSLQQYTNSFASENLIGVGMLGSVYRAELPDGQLLAVKKLDSSVPRDDESFLNLVSSISKLQHANVVKLVGYCVEHKQQLLVYEYCGGGTLNDILHSGDELNQKLTWNARIRLALGAARALEYLHEVCQPPVVHRNFKSANLLLDNELLAVRASDCGLAPLISSGSVRQLSGNILSSLGYGAPEFIQSGAYTLKSDVYSYGVVMLELLTGRKSHDSSRPRGEQHLARWATNHLHDIASLSRMVDPSLNGRYPEKSLSQFADIISTCIQSEPEFRPPMSDIVQNLLRMMPREPISGRSNRNSSSN